MSFGILFFYTGAGANGSSLCHFRSTICFVCLTALEVGAPKIGFDQRGSHKGNKLFMVTVAPGKQRFDCAHLR